MSRYPVHPKTIRGTAVTQREFLVEIVRIISDHPQGLNAEGVATLLGSEWQNTEALRVLRQTLINLAQRQTLSRLEKGVYALHHRYVHRGVSRGHLAEMEILHLVRENGGVIRPRDLLREMGFSTVGPRIRAPRPRDETPSKEAQNSPERSRISKTLARLVKDGKLHLELASVDKDEAWLTGLSDGTYCLPHSELSTCVLTGRTHHLLTKYWARTVSSEGWRGEYQIAYDRILAGVGAAAKQARIGKFLTLDEVAADPDILRELADISRTASAERRLVVQDIRDDVYQEAASRGGCSKSQIETEIARQSKTIHTRLLARFEGYKNRDVWPHSTLTHFYARPGFYRALGKVYGIDPVALSRGLLVVETQSPGGG